MKIAIKSSTEVQDPIDDCVELNRLLSNCIDLCSYLEDAYFGEVVVDDFIKCYKGLEKAQKSASSALSKLTTKEM